jgi:hypothetical protein
MALTASAHSALPSWDETIVPALRKRLESESRTLSKRISAASVVSYEELHSGISKFSSTSDSTVRDRTHIQSYSVQLNKGTAIPRPSVQKSRASEGGSRPDLSRLHGRGHSNGSPLSISTKPPYRTRTKSQPFPVDPSALPNGKANGTATGTRNVSTPNILQDTSQPLSPRLSDVKPTRIPKAPAYRGDRSGSVSSQSHGSIPGYPPTSPTSPTQIQMGNGHMPSGSQDLWAVDEHSNSSRRQPSEQSGFSTGPRLRRKLSEGSNYSTGPRRKGSGTLNEKLQHSTCRGEAFGTCWRMLLAGTKMNAYH